MDVRWECVDCPLCGGRKWSTLIEAADPPATGSEVRATVVRCRDCGLSFTNPRPTPESVGRFYPPDYGPHQSQPTRRPQAWKARLGPLRRRLRPGPLGRPTPGRNRLLDFGCGSGAFLWRMREEGWQVTGMDFSAAAVQRVRSELGLRALAGTLPNPDLAAESFDVVTLWQVLEHLNHPLDVLREVRRLLAPGGRLLVAVPNIDGLPFRLFGPDWFGLDVPRHLVHFSPTTLRRTVEAAGFDVTAIHMQSHSVWIQSSARRAARRGSARAWFRWLELRPVASLLGRYCVVTSQADDIVLSARKASSSAI